MEYSSMSSLLEASGETSSQRVDHFIAFIREANELLQKETDFSPANPLVSEVFNQLLAQMRSHFLPQEEKAILNNEYIRTNQQKFQDKLSEVEFLVELRNSHEICKLEGSVLDIIKGLPNWNNYFSLVSQELQMIRQYIKQDRNLKKTPIIFVGSGPMPISAIILHLLSDADVICLERNTVAYEASCYLLERLGLGNKVRVVLKDGSEFDFSSYSHIFVASLVRNKQAVLETISRTSENPVVAVRTAEGVSRIMYEAIDESQLNKEGWIIQGRTSPDIKLVVNSTLFLERVTNSSV